VPLLHLGRFYGAYLYDHIYGRLGANMTIFQLMVYSCVQYNIVPLMPYSDYTISCRWQPWGFHQSKESCEREAASQLGKPIFSDVADGRKVEKAQCADINIPE